MELKIGLLTFHRANNLGAVLQASALLEYVQENIGNCEIIDFYPNNGISVKYAGIKRVLRHCKWLVLYPFTVTNRKREMNFHNYRLKYYSLSDKQYIGDSGIANAHFDYDVIISGSDQILNTTLTGNSKAYYLDFFIGKKISYASSFGRKDISKEEIELIRSELPKFSALSVREQSGVDIIKREIGIKPQLVMDPVFLLSKDEWSKRCNEEMKLPEKYIFVYSMEVSPALENAVASIKKEAKLPVIVVRGGGKPRLIEGNEDGTCGPEEFLRYMRDAELIITNSFHGTAFSLIFEKKFLCVAHSTRNDRLANIMSIIGKEDSLLKCDSSVPVIVNGKEDSSTIKSYIKASKEYLKSAILK